MNIPIISCKFVLVHKMLRTNNLYNFIGSNLRHNFITYKKKISGKLLFPWCKNTIWSTCSKHHVREPSSVTYAFSLFYQLPEFTSNLLPQNITISDLIFLHNPEIVTSNRSYGIFDISNDSEIITTTILQKYHKFKFTHIKIVWRLRLERKHELTEYTVSRGCKI